PDVLLDTRRCSPPLFYYCPPPARTYPLSLHDALPISGLDLALPRLLDPLQDEGGQGAGDHGAQEHDRALCADDHAEGGHCADHRSEEHTSELQSRENLVCRLLLEKKKEAITNWAS